MNLKKGKEKKFNNPWRTDTSGPRLRNWFVLLHMEKALLRDQFPELCWEPGAEQAQIQGNELGGCWLNTNVPLWRGRKRHRFPSLVLG